MLRKRLMNVPNQKETVYWISSKTPLGECIIASTKNGICWIGSPGKLLDACLLHLKKYIIIESIIHDEKNSFLKKTNAELESYFAGKKIQFSCPMDLRGTPFQKTVLQKLQKIPYGNLDTYKNIAYEINYPTAYRAVGAAIGANPVSIAIPCHRVIGSNNRLTGYAGGLSIKKWLLALEGIEQAFLS